MKTARIITYHNSENYGAFLQAFALQNFLRNNGVDAKIQEYTSKTVYLGKIVNLVKTKGKSLWGAESSSPASEYLKRMGKKVVEEQKKLHTMSDMSQDVDVTILGSDEIWNAKNLGAAHDPFLFCPDKHAGKTISYAACSGNANRKHLSIFPYAQNGIKGLDAVSVRDDSTYNLITSIRSGKVERVLDPTFLIDFTEFVPPIVYEKPYLFVYTYGLSNDQILSIKNLADKHNLAIVATGTSCDWVDYNPAPSPFEWIGYIKNAEFVVTSTFHGTVLAIQQGVDLAVYNTKSPKIHSILKELNLLDRAVTDCSALEDIYEAKMDYNTVNQILCEHRTRSQQYLLSFFMGGVY